ncbi:hypothetical protein Clacol_002887 [Clathrus columnatus]|uniref:Adenosine deaminase domain-containing protein n=1 Tax=Clathrus columnatus TaxID=1419009 RepID=A0AAV5A7Q2_9AGAM|nr:hypothetical protein Clacol_002887 [Clathrus columnatus]
MTTDKQKDPCTQALHSLSGDQLKFLQNLPKAELHAHLNGSIPLPCLQALAKEHPQFPPGSLPETIIKGLDILSKGFVLNDINDFFGLFPAIYALTSTPKVLSSVTRDVLTHFLEPGPDGSPAQCSYMELRSTPRMTEHMSRQQYLIAVLDEIEKYPANKAVLIVSIDRRMSLRDLTECVDLSIALKEVGRRIVGIDLCGDPLASDMNDFRHHFLRAKEAGLKITLHIAETPKNTEEDTLTLLSFGPSRLGHATFLSDKAQDIILRERIPIEIFKSLEEHHIQWFLKRDHPIAICTDDILPFRNSLVGEYALLMADPPFGLGLTENEIRRIAEMGFESKF